MSKIDFNVLFEFESLLTLSREECFRELVITAQTLAQVSQRIGFLRAEEVRNPREPYIKAERVEAESLRTAYEEKKWVLIRLLDLAKP